MSLKFKGDAPLKSQKKRKILAEEQVDQFQKDKAEKEKYGQLEQSALKTFVSYKSYTEKKSAEALFKQLKQTDEVWLHLSSTA